MKYVRLAPNARRVHETVDGDVTVCNRIVPSFVAEFNRTNNPRYRTTKRQFVHNPCQKCKGV